MDEQRWRRERDDRSLRYAGRVLDPERWITLTADPDYLERYDGQVALLTATNLLGRMTPSVALSFPDTRLHPSIPWLSSTLHEAILRHMNSADPFGSFCARGPARDDIRLHFGREGKGIRVHGSGWNAYVGPASSPLPDTPDGNPIGAALAAVLVASQLFVRGLAPPARATVVDALTWRSRIGDQPAAIPVTDLGRIFVVGIGSVGTAVLYFLLLANRPFSPTLIDMDRVKLHNLDRSPVFAHRDIGELKIHATRSFLHAGGVSDVETDSTPLHESDRWMRRTSGTPDVLVSAANEMNVRYHVEMQYPPIQIYGTTGLNWQASLIRHTPLVEACSCCLFPNEVPQPPLRCGSAPAESVPGNEQQVDVALPFLSFAAGLMAAAEILKLQIPGYPFSPNRVSLLSRPAPRFVAARIPRREGCLCNDRSPDIHRGMLEGSRFASLSRLRQSASYR